MSLLASAIVSGATLSISASVTGLGGTNLALPRLAGASTKAFIESKKY